MWEVVGQPVTVPVKVIRPNNFQKIGNSELDKCKQTSGWYRVILPVM